MIDIKAVRKALGLSQGAFARKIEVTPVSVHRWESGARGIDTKHLLSIAKLFELATIEELEARFPKAESTAVVGG